MTTNETKRSDASPDSAVPPDAVAVDGTGDGDGATHEATRRFIPVRPDHSNYVLWVLFGLNIVDEFATHAFGLLAPEIRAAFNLSNFGFGNVFAVNALVGIALIPLVGWLGDRRNRVRITQIGAVVAGVGALVIGMAPAIWILVIGRMLIDAGRFIPETIHNSLIADYYPKRERPLAFAIHRGGNELGYVVAPLIAAGMALWLGWRWAFLFAVVPTTIMLLLSLRLDEPVRGASEESEASDELVDEPPVPYRVAVRQLLAIRTLRRSWVASAFILKKGAKVGGPSTYALAPGSVDLTQRPPPDAPRATQSSDYSVGHGAGSSMRSGRGKEGGYSVLRFGSAGFRFTSSSSAPFQSFRAETLFEGRGSEPDASADFSSPPQQA